MESQKNAHRLNRIFRKPKAMVAPRAWRPATDSKDGRQQIPFSGVSVHLIDTMICHLTQQDRLRALAGQDPPSVVAEELAKRAARFGLTVAEADDGNGTALGGSSAELTAEMQATLERRMDRFGQKAEDEAMQRRMARFGTWAAGAPAVELKLSDADREAMERRERRFVS